MKSKAAFTRKDVIVVLGCVVFLLATVGAIGESGRKRAKQMVCLSNLRQWGTAFMMFADDNEGYFMGGRPSDNWWSVLEPYYKERNLLLCPTAVDPDKNPWEGYGNFGTWGPTWFPEGFYGSYGVNEWVNNPLAHPQVYRPEEYWRTPNAAGAETIPLLLDAYWDQGWVESFDWVPDWPGQWESVGMDDMAHFMIVRHPGGDNCGVFMDYSARVVNVRDLWFLRWHRNYPDGELAAELNDPEHWLNNLSHYD